MTLLLLIFLCQANADNPMTKDSQAIWIPLDSPLVDIPITSLVNGSKTNFNEVGDNGITFIFTPNCEYCKRAYDLVAAISETYNCFVLFSGNRKDVLAFLAEKGETDYGHVFLVDAKHLTPYNIKIVPAVLGYRDNQLTLAMHGPFTMGSLQRILSNHRTGSRVSMSPKSKQ
ncbi:MAG: hypothetical protein QNK37_14940 [Acidobacteriota bacterium]|nr:hypothetical protein [Acidobacteriota bacterium]